MGVFKFMKDFVLGSEAVALNVKLSEIFDDNICKDMWNNALKTMRDDDPNRYINMIHREQTLINGQIMILNSHINKIPAEMTNRYPHQVSDMVVQLRRAQKYLNFLNTKETEYYKSDTRE